ncbi:MAG TPA: DUF2891 domain-containing protein [Burkholderiaceae bacterium]|nr:DUF2891 domain-containing protein [Burkholderiaceae bacterium]
MPQLTPAQAECFAGLALANITTEYPHHLAHLLHSADDARPPRALHPAFYGSYDWHSSVHMHWLLVRVLRLFDGLSTTHGIVATLDAHLSSYAIEGELAYFNVNGRATFERPYGWAWLLKLASEVDACAQRVPQAHAWKAALAPLARELALRLNAYLSAQTYPTRSGTHGNTAFAMLLALDWCNAAGDTVLATTIRERAHAWFMRDRDYPARYEPSGDDFLSAGLVEALLMRRLLGNVPFAMWWREFSPKGDEMAFWLQPAHVVDRSDAKTVHLDGLNLSRAWCLEQLAPSIDLPQRAAMELAAQRHREAALPYVANGAYVGTHWLASYAVLALTE